MVSRGRHATGLESDITDVAFGAGVFAVVDEFGGISTSPTLDAWTPRSTGITQSLHRIVFANGTFMAVGGSASSPLLLTSPTGTRGRIAPPC